jgi:hypothetical protein
MMKNYFFMQKQQRLGQLSLIKKFHTTNSLRIEPATTMLVGGATARASVYITIALLFIGYTVTTGVVIWNLVSNHQSEVQFALMFPTSGPDNIVAMTVEGLEQIDTYLFNVEVGVQFYSNISNIEPLRLNELHLFSEGIDCCIKQLALICDELYYVLDLDDSRINVTIQRIINAELKVIDLVENLLRIQEAAERLIIERE